MDLLSFINHLQKKVRSGGATKRVHGIGQGHDASVVDTLAGDPSADLPTDAASGYMNADMLDGYHAKQVYQGKAPAVYSGLNADTLDGVDKSLGHVEGALNFNSTDGTAATAAITFSGSPKQGDTVKLKLYGPDGTQIGNEVVANISTTNPTLEDVCTAVKTAIGANASVLAAFANNGADSDSGSNKVLTLTTAQKGPRANLYLLVVSITKGAQSNLYVDKTPHGIYRFKGGGPEEGINADKLDDLHARETYQGKAPALYSGLNADTLDGVDKSLGHVATASTLLTRGQEIAATAAITFSGSPKQNDVVTLKLYGPDGTQVGTNVTANISTTNPTLEDVRTAVKTAITANESVLAAFTGSGTDTDSGSNKVLTLTTAQKGPRANLYVLVVTVTNVAQSTLVVDKTHGVYRFSGGGPEEGINADKLDDLHARETYHGIAPPDGSGINADTLDGYHAGLPSGGSTGKYIPRVLEGELTGTFARDSFNPRLIGEGIKAPQSHGWLISAGMYEGGSIGDTTYSGGIPEFVVSDIKQNGTRDWAWVIRTFNNHPNGGGTNWDATSWQDGTATQRGYLRWVANTDKYLGTYVDRAALADGLVDGTAGLTVSRANIADSLSTYKRDNYPSIQEVSHPASHPVEYWGEQLQGYTRLSVFKVLSTRFDKGPPPPGDNLIDVEWTISVSDQWTVIGAMTNDTVGDGGIVTINYTVGVRRGDKITTNSSGSNPNSFCFISVWLLEPGAVAPSGTGWS